MSWLLDFNSIKTICSIHNLAFKLDCEAVEPELVETLYKKAISLNPKFLRARSDFVIYLLTRGRPIEAIQVFHETLAENTEYCSELVFTFLTPVLFWSLHWGKPLLAGCILNKIKKAHIEGFKELAALRYWRIWLDEKESFEGQWNEELQKYEEMPFDEIHKKNLPKFDRDPDRWYNRAVKQSWATPT